MANRRGPSSLWGLVGLVGAVAGLNVFPQARDGSSRPAPLLGPRQQDAMCGVNSPGGSVKCGMNVCCSGAGWCGTTEAHCSIPNGCQQGFGHCGALRTPLSCDPAAKSTNQRSVGYYQAVAAYDRPSCGAVAPSQINTAGYTHLYFSFVSMDPATFAVKEFDARDVPLLSQFTALKSRGVQTWVAVGGFRFSDADQPTHQTWSNMVATQANRARFISSLTAFMAQYGFQGADIDWEWPVDPARGGRPGDTAGLVALVREMRAAFGTRYGISIAVPPDYPALRYFDLQAMEPSLDFIGFMSYDLRTASDPSGVVKSHTNLSDIAELAKPLWFAGLNPFKINLGLASYARGFTVRSPGSCPRADRLGCPFSGPNKGGPCTASPGVMSLSEVNRLISEKGLRPVTLGDATVKVVTYDGDQWLGYDDAETWAAKKSWANSLCIGGTMVWSLDFHNDPGTPGPNPSPSTALDHGGRCGAAVNGGTVCGAWPDGNCCSSSGWCGRSAAHCGEGCVSGDCQAASGGGGNSGGPPVSKDGRCGRDFGGAVCTGWPDGECCSAAGWCGRTSAHCGSGCQSGCS